MTAYPELSDDNVLDVQLGDGPVARGIHVLRCDECGRLFHREAFVINRALKLGVASVTCSDQCRVLFARGRRR